MSTSACVDHATMARPATVAQEPFGIAPEREVGEREVGERDVEQVHALLRRIVESGGFPPTPAGVERSRLLAGRASLLTSLDVVCRRAFHAGDAACMRLVQELLAQLYEERFRIPRGAAIGRRPGAEADDVVELIEGYLLAGEEAGIDPLAIDDAPGQGMAFVRWLLDLVDRHPAARHPYYEDFLATADRDDLVDFCIQESTLDPRFDDVLALLQIGTPDGMKMEIARNYWDEMGNGDLRGLHTNMFRDVLRALDADADVRVRLHTESLACGNLSMLLALHRCHFPTAVGYFGVTELLVPRRFGHVINAWNRVGLDPAGIAYYRLHQELDEAHGDAWLDQVVVPLVDMDGAAAPAICRGALYRMNSSQRYLDSLLAHAWDRRR